MGESIDHRVLQLWETDEMFRTLLAQAKTRSLVDPGRMYLLYQFALAVEKLEGGAAEVGVYRGGTARLLAAVLRKSGKIVDLFDTFEGLPTVDPKKDWHKTGEFADTSVESVRQFLSDMPNAKIYPGLFPATAEAIEGRRFALVHVDVDIYSSVLACCEFFYPRMNRAGIIVFDDYGFPSCPGAKKAVDDFFREKPERPVYFPTGQAVIIKL